MPNRVAGKSKKDNNQIETITQDFKPVNFNVWLQKPNDGNLNRQSAFQRITLPAHLMTQEKKSGTDLAKAGRSSDSFFDGFKYTRDF